MGSCDIGLIGLAVMGQNLALNMEDHGFCVAVYNRTAARTREFMEKRAKGRRIVATYNVADLVAALKRPRIVMLMVKAGPPVDAVIEQLLPYVEPGDIIIDGGNSFFKDTERRAQYLAERGIHFLGVGISGGEEGARHGPSIMPGGPREAYEVVRPIFEAIAAKVDGEPCVTYLGPRGAGHFVKMVHNGIEYGDMQLIAETYDIMHRGLGLDAPALHQVFARWNQGVLSSYLIEITADIFTKVDEVTGKPLVDVILDVAEQKGTGLWTTEQGLELKVPIPTINAAVEARIISMYKEERVQASKVLEGPEIQQVDDTEEIIQQLEQALYMAKITSYAQGFALLRKASDVYEYGYDYGEIARIWRGGCIIRARFLDDIRRAFARRPDLPNLMLDPFFRDAVNQRHPNLRFAVRLAAGWGIPVPAMGASLAYYDAYRSARLPANLIQAQRDYFGAHTYRRIDMEGVFHTQWTED
ncbi:MAG: NADP-dependent phosphogluconate dehydrogenase [Chloroflexi bacterium]|nr:NADP-dependent phosphogluconate dehydrogenase [Chloroflexota bacterium]